MKIKLSKYTPIKVEGTIIIPKVSILTKEITLEDQARIYPNSNAIHVMREDTMLEIVLETKITLTRIRETREETMLML